jgi:arginine-tRNA-protein transferase
VVVDRFSPTKSQRRVVRKNQFVHTVVRPPTVTQDHIDLFNRYHASMSRERGWPCRQTDADDYFRSFLSGRYEFEREILYLHDKSLVGVGLVDVTRQSLSSVYFYHEPHWRPNGPGIKASKSACGRG